MKRPAAAPPPSAETSGSNWLLNKGSELRLGGVGFIECRIQWLYGGGILLGG